MVPDARPLGLQRERDAFNTDWMPVPFEKFETEKQVKTEMEKGAVAKKMELGFDTNPVNPVSAVAIKSGKCGAWKYCTRGAYITPGQKTTSVRVKASDAYPRRFHEECYKSLNPFSPTVSAGQEAEVVEVEATEITEQMPRKSKATPASSPLGDSLSETLAAALAPFLPKPTDIDEARVIEICKTFAGGSPLRIEIKTPDVEEIQELGEQHCQLPDLLTTLHARDHKGYALNVWVAGPAGSGKTTAAEVAAAALNLDFAFDGVMDQAYSLLGYKDAKGEYQGTHFRRIYEKGGVYLKDECDADAPGVGLAINAAISNGQCSFPDAIVKRHPKFHFIASANTWGHGANGEYVGRAKQDGAFLDRFVHLAWDYDEKLEKSLAGNDAWVGRVHKTRAKVRELGIKVLVTPRASILGAALLRAGLTEAKVVAMTLRRGMSDDQWNRVTA